jgi:hypothetical protein
MTTTDTFDLDAFERRMERQRVIEPGDVELVVEALRSERAARSAVTQERDQWRGDCQVAWRAVEKSVKHINAVEAERDRARADVERLTSAIIAEWAAWYHYDSDPMHQDAAPAHAASAALWALVGKEPAP